MELKKPDAGDGNGDDEEEEPDDSDSRKIAQLMGFFQRRSIILDSDGGESPNTVGLLILVCIAAIFWVSDSSGFEIGDFMRLLEIVPSSLVLKCLA